MFDNLVRRDPRDSGQSIVPDLAHSWQVSKDGKSIVKGTAYDIARSPFQSNLDLIKTDGQPSFGAAAGAPVNLVMFSDFQCPYCQMEAVELRKNIPAAFNDKVRVFFMDFPLTQIHPWAMKASIAGRCTYRANQNAFWEYHDWIYQNQKDVTLETFDAKFQEYAKQKGLDALKPVRALGLDAEELELLKPLCLITAKPALYVANVDEKGFENNPLLDRVREYAAKEHAPVVAICAALEAEIADLSDEDKSVFLADVGMSEPGLNRLIRAAYDLLGLQTYFTAGEKEVRAWTMHKGDTAPQAAGVIHTDFEKGFIRAEVIAYDDYVKFKGEHGAKEAGKMRLEGKEYVVKDGDVMHFRFNV